jgi:hypothetical protein
LTNTKGVLDFELENVTVELQHINVKLLVKDPDRVNVDAVVPVFHSWIQGQVCDELLLDVADYSHVPDGPGIVLIGHEADYALDNTNSQLGVRYSRKAPMPGDNSERLQQAVRSALLALQRLDEDLKLNFNGRDIELAVNDRLLAPNNAETRSSVEPEFNRLFAALFGGEGYTLTYPSDPRSLFRVAARASREFSVSELLQNLNPSNEAR